MRQLLVSPNVGPCETTISITTHMHGLVHVLHMISDVLFLVCSDHRPHVSYFQCTTSIYVSNLTKWHIALLFAILTAGP